MAADARGLGSLEPTSPRSVEACLRLGIEPGSLRYRPPDAFQATGQAGDLAELAYNFKEAVRQARHPPTSLTVQGHMAPHQVRHRASHDNAKSKQHGHVWNPALASTPVYMQLHDIGIEGSHPDGAAVRYTVLATSFACGARLQESAFCLTL